MTCRHVHNRTIAEGHICYSDNATSAEIMADVQDMVSRVEREAIANLSDPGDPFGARNIARDPDWQAEQGRKAQALSPDELKAEYERQAPLMRNIHRPNDAELMRDKVRGMGDPMAMEEHDDGEG